MTATASLEPAIALVPIAGDVWQVQGPAMRFPGGVQLPLNSTLMRLPDRSLLLYSPIKIDDAMAAEIDALGDVAHIVAPNLLHHLHVGAASQRWPRAIVHAVPGLATKCSELRIDRELGPVDATLRDVIDIELIGGAPKINEAVVFHRASGTLACADLLFNVTHPANLRTKLVLAMMGTGGRRLAQSRVWKFSVRDRAATRASIDRMLAWPVAHVSPSHGEPAAVDAATFAATMRPAYGKPVAPARAMSASG